MFGGLKLPPIFLDIIHMRQKNTFVCFGKSVRLGSPHLTSYIITHLHPFSLERLELFMLFHVRLHGIEAFSEQQHQHCINGRTFSVQEIISLNLTVKTNIGLERGGETNLHVITEAILI